MDTNPATNSIPGDHLYLSTVLDSVACGVILLDREMKVVQINRSAQMMTGYKLEEASGRPCREILKPFLEDDECPIESCLRNGITREELSLQIRTKDGSELPVRVVSHVLRDSSGETIGGVQTFGDITTVHDLRITHDRRYYFQGIVSRHHKMQELFQILPRLAESNSTVMIRGESGTGKELVARSLHNLSLRKEKPFVAVNCAALPDTLLEAELFGYVKGAFTDARNDRAGRIAAAEGGTLFLDEVGDISPAMQVKLLRFLQEHTFEPLGSNRSQLADVRVVAATNRNLEALMRQGRFRDDFYYRLNVLSVEIPPLRDRPEDVPLLTDHMLQRWALANGRDTVQVTPMAMKGLIAYDYPGNVRELENIIERAAVLAVDSGVDLANLPDELRERVIHEHSERESGLIRADAFSPIELSERETIRDTLRDTGGNRIVTAERLAMSRTTLWRKMVKYGLK
ncbi:MAG: sigma 54-interacting transcriptional regulator [bacterium]